MSHVFPRHCHSDLPTAVGGEGCYLIDAEGKRYFDGSGGAAVSCLGHSNQRVRDAIKAQVEKLAFAHTGFLTSEPAEALADLLIANAPGDLDRVYFVSGGSEAVESAIKLARQYHVERGEPQRRHLIARRQSYHGNTIGALSAGGNAWRRQQFAPLLVEMSHIAPCYDYAERPEGESLEAYGLRVADELEAEILRLGTDSVMAFIAEPVVGATLGAVPSVPGYFRRVREICDTYGVLLILDEVMCGMGRTGHLFACDAEGIAPDILCIAKGLGAGYQPIGAMLCSKQIYETIANGTGFFQHGHTYLGHPVAAAAGLAVVQEMLENDLPAQVQARGAYLQSALEARFGQHAHVGDIRGRGLFRGLEFVADRSTKEPFDPKLGIAGKLKKAAFAEGLICYPMPGTRDGRHGDHVLLAPPFIATEAELDEMIVRLSRAVDTVMAGL
ncbi:aspartate aminotransferase family protein (plasmid) [Alloyangia pacifica]|uniref:Aspartate aminotransferase family protein n=1 Tax=Alloyangia pacifica TaxID=311180 RepID=A0A2U8HM95_9RHOB|nr:MULTISPECIES: aspartate aminotransferase family protein [Roseobacteraceae]AWI86861.1 aspartate aminotransferase family protein [Alloyangia pacifica]NDW31787.1 aspartate aminotransferase family protein [Salipiger sp. PrR007]